MNVRLTPKVLGAKAATEEAVRAKRITFIVAIMASLGANKRWETSGLVIVEEQIFEKRPDCDVCMSEILERCLKNMCYNCYILRTLSSLPLFTLHL